MRTIILGKVAVVSVMLLAVLAGCTGTAQIVSGKKMPLVFEADFEDGRLDAWQATDPAAWRIEDGRGGKVLAQFKLAFEHQPCSGCCCGQLRDGT